jgi:hypothetical protein
MAQVTSRAGLPNRASAMTSVRLRTSRYSVLPDVPTTPQPPPPQVPAGLEALIQSRHRSASEADVAPPPRPTLADSPESPHMPFSTSLRVPGPPPSGRRRSFSRVSQHLMGRGSINSLGGGDPSRLPSPPSTIGSPRIPVMIGLEGAQADILVPANIQSGSIGSALSLPHEEQGSIIGEHHPDEIVEHLDVIGV